MFSGPFSRFDGDPPRSTRPRHEGDDRLAVMVVGSGGHTLDARRRAEATAPPGWRIVVAGTEALPSARGVDVLGPVENAHLQEDRLPNVQFLYPDECGHQGQTDQPELFNQVFTEFFSSGSLTRPTAAQAGISTRRPELSNIVREGS